MQSIVHYILRNLNSMAYVACMFLVVVWMKISVKASNVEEIPPVDYTGHKILSVSIDTDNKMQYVKNLQKTYEDGIQYWGHDFPVGDIVNIHVSKEHADHVENKMKEHNLTYNVVCEDLGKLIRLERSTPRNLKLEEFGYNFGKHNDFLTIENYLLQVTKNNRNVSKLSVIGKSFENRPLYSVQISNGNGYKKLAILIECGMHAREWSSVEACIYMIEKFIHPGRNGEEINAILSLYDIIIIPIINPDGYIYTWTTDRMWRKTRSCYEEVCYDPCVGIDGNRNFDANFCQGRYASPDPCRSFFCGREPFCEPETAAVRDVIQNLGNHLFGYFSIHSFGALWLTPYGKSQELPRNYEELVRVGEIAVAAIARVNGIQFKVGSTANLLYPSTGTSADYAYDTGKAKYSYSIELREGKVSHGFVVDETEILPMCTEIFEGIKAAILAFRN